MRTRIVAALGLLLGATTALSPSQSAAQLYFPSTMGAECVGISGCDTIDFFLQPTADVYSIEAVTLTTTDFGPGGWSFARFWDLPFQYNDVEQDGMLWDVWTGYITNDGTSESLNSAYDNAIGNWATELLHGMRLRVYFDNFQDFSALDGVFAYSVIGRDANGELSATEGVVRTAGSIDPHVAPEPASMILLGTGLAGMVGAARRRRNASASL